MFVLGGLFATPLAVVLMVLARMLCVEDVLGDRGTNEKKQRIVAVEERRDLQSEMHAVRACDKAPRLHALTCAAQTILSDYVRCARVQPAEKLRLRSGP
jgi:hypothetical protein